VLVATSPAAHIAGARLVGLPDLSALGGVTRRSAGTRGGTPPSLIDGVGGATTTDGAP
jgi:hypothetical protein